MVQVHEGRGERHRWSQHDRTWRQVSRAGTSLPAPASLAEMLSAAEQLGAGCDFVRVDLYEVGGRPWFGEFCLYPGSGLDRFDPVALDDWLGAHWAAERHAAAATPAPFQPRGAPARSA